MTQERGPYRVEWYAQAWRIVGPHEAMVFMFRHEADLWANRLNAAHAAGAASAGGVVEAARKMLDDYGRMHHTCQAFAAAWGTNAPDLMKWESAAELSAALAAYESTPGT